MVVKIKKRIFAEDDFFSKIIQEIHADEILDVSKILPLVTPGTELRRGLDEVLNGNLGAIIVLGNSDKLKPIIKGGIDLDIQFSSQKLFELSKMDGAIVLSNDLQKIVGANKHLMPDKDVPSKETGMRHRSAEQTALYTGLPVIAISQRRNVISLYFRDQKYILQNFEILMIKANYFLNNLKSFREKIDKKLKSTLSQEYKNSATLKVDIIELIQNLLYFFKHEKQIDDLIVELGDHGQDISNTLYEVTYGLDEDFFLILKDYSNNPLISKQEAQDKLNLLKQLGLRRISDTEKLVELLEFTHFFSDTQNSFPRGYRALSKIQDLDEKTISDLIFFKKSLYNIKNLTPQDLSSITKIDAVKIKKIIFLINKKYAKKNIFG